MTRTFETKDAVRKNIPLIIGIMGTSAAGKTMSALRLATGIQRVCPGDIHVIDTENGRALHYADDFKFKHLNFRPPFGPLEYLAAIEHTLKQKPSTIVVDSMSHEHEGPGGVLEMHTVEHDRLGGKEGTKMLAWAKPKSERQRLINCIQQMNVNFIFCFRAKDKIKMDPKARNKEDKVRKMGFMAIAGEEFVYEMVTCALLKPGAEGVPTWNPTEEGEKMMVKRPRYFRKLFNDAGNKPLDEDIGESMARWAAGESIDLFVFPKGDYKGQTIEQVPPEYLTKLAEDSKTSKRFVSMCESELKRRGSQERPGGDEPSEALGETDSSQRDDAPSDGTMSEEDERNAFGKPEDETDENN